MRALLYEQNHIIIIIIVLNELKINIWERDHNSPAAWYFIHYWIIIVEIYNSKDTNNSFNEIKRRKKSINKSREKNAYCMRDMEHSVMNHQKNIKLEVELVS